MIVKSLNVNGWMPHKRQTIQTLSEGADVLCLTETWTQLLEEDVPKGFIVYSIDGYATEGRFRKGGGLSLLVSSSHRSKLVRLHGSKQGQMVGVTVNGLPVVGLYLRPELSSIDAKLLWKEVVQASRGSAVILGDFNARHVRWDDATNANGRFLVAAASTNNLTISAPSAPTFVGNRGTSIVDLVLTRNVTVTKIGIQEDVDTISDHRAVIGEIALASPRSSSGIPLSVIRNRVCQTRVAGSYERSGKSLCNMLIEVNSGEELENAARRVAHATLEPWAAECAPKPGRFRPGWNRELDRLAKTRSRLQRRTDAASRAQAKSLDRLIKRRFRRNRRRMLDDCGEALESHCQPDATSAMTRLLALATSSPRVTSTFSHNTYLEYFGNRQPPPEEITPVERFIVTDEFQTHVRTSILRLPKRKAPGPDKIRMEIFQLFPDHFCKVITLLWKAVGRLGYVPTLLRSGWLVPVYKNKGDPSSVENYRPIVLLSCFRKVISSALTIELRKEYTVHPHQWGFQSKMNTEMAIARAIQQQDRGYTIAAILDLRQAYDRVPRVQLLQLLKKRVSTNLWKSLTGILSPVTIATREPESPRLTITTGVTQGDPISPFLFNIYMDTFLRVTNEDNQSFTTNCFADDVLVQAKQPHHLQEALQICSNWSRSAGIPWNVQKSFAIDSPSSYVLSGDVLQCVDEATYLGITLSRTGIGDTCLLERIRKALAVQGQISRVTSLVRHSTQRRRILSRTFVLPLVDYVSYLQPITSAVALGMAALEKRILSYVLRVSLKTPTDVQRARVLARIPSFQQRRLSQALRTICKFKSWALSSSSDLQVHRCWNILRHIAPMQSIIAEHHPPDEPVALQEWGWKRPSEIVMKEWTIICARVQRKIPIGKSLPPALRGGVSDTAERKAVLWYLNNLPMRVMTKADAELLRNLLQRDALSQENESELERLLHSVHLTAPLRGKRRTTTSGE